VSDINSNISIHSCSLIKCTSVIKVVNQYSSYKLVLAPVQSTCMRTRYIYYLVI